MHGRMARQSALSNVATAANAVAKLERAFHSSVSVYHRLKHGNRQVIRIEKVVVEAGAQAIVGQVVGG